MIKRVSRLFIIAALFFLSAWKYEQPVVRDIQYACTPCGAGCDTTVHNGPGTCSHCNMALVDKSTIVHKSIQPDKMCSLNEKNIVFLDVRTPAEFNGTAEDKFGAIKNAINIPVQELQSRMNELEKYKDKDVAQFSVPSSSTSGVVEKLTYSFTPKNDLVIAWDDRQISIPIK